MNKPFQNAENDLVGVSGGTTITTFGTGTGSDVYDWDVNRVQSVIYSDTKSSGVRVAVERYMPWGESRYTYGSTLTTFGGAMPTTFKFTGQRVEARIGTGR